MIDVQAIACGKVEFKTYSEAVYAADKIGKRTGVPWNAYKCEFCGFYHVGHKRLYGKKRKHGQRTRSKQREELRLTDHEQL